VARYLLLLKSVYLGASKSNRSTRVVVLIAAAFDDDRRLERRLIDGNKNKNKDGVGGSWARPGAKGAKTVAESIRSIISS